MSTATQSIREIVTLRPSAASIFHRFDIDLCVQADLSLEDACRELQLSVDQVLEKLADAEMKESGGELNPESLSAGRLIQHIVRVYHHRVRQQLPELAAMASKVASKQDRDPELARVAASVERLRSEMYVHIEKEEQILFPFISQMALEARIDQPSAHKCFRTIARPILMMEQEHDSASHIMVELRRITNEFEPPVWACATHTALLSGLRDFDADFRQHIHLENDVLFPRAIQLEADLKARN